MNNLFLIMLRCLSLTIIIEVLVAFILNVKDKRDYYKIVFINIVTNPIVVSIPLLIYHKFGYTCEIVSLYILEIITVIVEGLFYKKLKYKKLNPFILSLLLNMTSYFIGELINML